MLDLALEHVIGDVLISSGFVAYLGPFTVSRDRRGADDLLISTDDRLRPSIVTI